MVKNKMNNKTKLFLFEVFVFNFFSLIGIDLAFSEELSTKAVLKREGKNLVLSANNKNYKLSCKTPGCIVYKCAQYGCKDGKHHISGETSGVNTKFTAEFYGCNNVDNKVVCSYRPGAVGGCGDQGTHWKTMENGNCSTESFTYFAGHPITFCNNGWIRFTATPFCVRTECMTQGCTEWEINGKDFLALFPSVGMATIDPNNIEF